MVSVNCVSVYRVRKGNHLTPEEPDRWNTEHDQKNVPPSASGLSVALTNGYDLPAKSCHMHTDPHHFRSPTAFVSPFSIRAPSVRQAAESRAWWTSMTTTWWRRSRKSVESWTRWGRSTAPLTKRQSKPMTISENGSPLTQVRQLFEISLTLVLACL